MSTTIKDVATYAGVSVGTASMALNNKPGINEQTKQKVLQAAKELNYRPNQYARFLTAKKTNVVGLIVTDITNPFFSNMINYIQQELSTFGFEIMLGISEGSISTEKKLVKKFIDMRTDGIVIVPSHKPTPDVSYYDELKRLNIPFCFITSYYPSVNAPCIMTDLSDGAYQLTKYLLSTGHERIAYIVGNRTVPVSNLRVEGYLAAYRETDITTHSYWVVEDSLTFQGGYRGTERILERFRPDAIITANDFMAMGVMKCLKDRQLSVPNDISVAGYDDILYSSLLETPLTTVYQPVESMCTQAVKHILTQIQEKSDFTEKILHKPILRIRDSSAPRKTK